MKVEMANELWATLFELLLKTMIQTVEMNEDIHLNYNFHNGCLSVCVRLSTEKPPVCPFVSVCPFVRLHH